MTQKAVTQETVQAPGWRAGTEAPAFDPVRIGAYLRRIREPLHLVTGPDSGIGIAPGGEPIASGGEWRLTGILPALYPEWLGDRAFAAAHGVRFPYVAGEMANGIATTRMVVALARAELLGFFGAAGLGVDRVERAVHELTTTLGRGSNWGVNLIHSPAEPELEERVADLLLRHGVQRISASAYTDITPAVARCAVTGLRVDRDGTIVRPVWLFAKVSRPETAAAFLSPVPQRILDALVGRGQLTADEAWLAARVPVATDVTVEADSGGHTDNRPLSAVLPAVLALRDELSDRYGYQQPVRVGAAGGLGTPLAVAGAFALGAAYVLTGSVNQLAVESGVSDDARALLAQADLADVAMAPAADMFEMGVRVQVLRRGTMYAMRAGRLYEVYRDHASLEAVPAAALAALERDVLHATVEEIWTETRAFWQQRDPGQLVRAERDPRHRMALLFRWYLGKSSRWAIDGDTGRRTDYQLWAGPAVGAFNRWTRGSFLAEPGERTVTQIALNLLEGAAVVTRAHQARTFGVPVPPEAFAFAPRRLV
ncbi:PfaD family polyunsaturated fatty acid/polyketide biosynthesis protein [Virgisporangium aurantiacum]|uniref:Oxidoreductase n=1 Tax=Virgisporangium aurantiacum TaxID=175570 RepID=A0A8J4E2Z0_9ACTN|nr:PfaD family polyunsaturated fatty acid/polyketide biosynthesis protein [Virgisporangium aurantiacum]GIJ60340.1 oxidoreductase [Virgisporangium aurantiacum]